MAFKVHEWPLTRFREYAANPRINDHAVAQMAAMIKEFGFRVPVIAKSDGELVDGHLRLKAARQLGLTKLPVVLADDLTDIQIRALRIAVNQAAQLADWDLPLLRAEIGELKVGGFDLPLLGFDGMHLVQFLAGQSGAADPELIPEVPTEPVSRPGDLWMLGAHRVLCGDCTETAHVERLLGEMRPHLMVTDPPYGVGYDPQWRDRDLQQAWSSPKSVGLVANDDKSDWTEAWKLFGGDVLYCWHPPGATSIAFYNSLAASEFEIRMQIIWAKPHFPIGRGNYHIQHEPCWYAVRKGKTAHWQGSRKETTLWEIDNASAFKGSRGEGDEQTGHSTQKPIECMRRPIENNSQAGDAVYDPFVGSGTTVIAAEMTARRCLALEIMPAYVDVAVERWQAFSGKEATLDGTGQTMAQVRAARAQGASTAPPDKASAPKAKAPRKPRAPAVPAS